MWSRVWDWLNDLTAIFWTKPHPLSNFEMMLFCYPILRHPYDLIWRTHICNLLNYFSWYEYQPKTWSSLKPLIKCIFLSSLQSDIEWNTIDINFIHIYWITVVQIYLDKHIIYSGKLFSTRTFGFLCHVYIVFRYIDPLRWVSNHALDAEVLWCPPYGAYLWEFKVMESASLGLDNLFSCTEFYLHLMSTYCMGTVWHQIYISLYICMLHPIA